MLPQLVPPGGLTGRLAVVIDVLRATSTIVQAMSAGARSVSPCMTPEDAVRVREVATTEHVILGGERGALPVPGFDLGNSPQQYTPSVVEGKTVALSTTNGTRAILGCLEADEVLIACFGNASAVADALARDGRPVHLVCSGTNGAIAAEDCLVAGHVIERLRMRVSGIEPCDSGRIVHAYSQQAAAEPGGVLRELRRSAGGTNLARVGLEEDIAWCSREDRTTVVPRYCKRTGGIING